MPPSRNVHRWAMRMRRQLPSTRPRARMGKECRAVRRQPRDRRQATANGGAAECYGVNPSFSSTFGFFAICIASSGELLGVLRDLLPDFHQTAKPRYKVFVDLIFCLVHFIEIYCITFLIPGRRLDTFRVGIPEGIVALLWGLLGVLEPKACVIHCQQMYHFSRIPACCTIPDLVPLQVPQHLIIGGGTGQFEWHALNSLRQNRFYVL